MSIDQEKKTLILKTLSDDLGEGLVATEIWTASDGLPLVNDKRYNSNPKVASLFNEVTKKLSKILNALDYPGLGNYYFINLDNNLLAVVFTIGSYRQFVVADIAKIPVGLLISVVLPNLLNILTDERKVKKLETPKVSEKQTELKNSNISSQKVDLKEVLNAFAGGIYCADKAE